MVLDKATVAGTGYRIGDTVTLIAGQGSTVELQLVGVATFGKLDNFSGSSAALVDTPTAQQLFGEPGKFDWIAVAGEPGVSQRTLVEHIDASGLPPGDEAITGAQFTKESQDVFRKAIGTFKTVLVAFALVSLFVGAFIIYNTFSIIVAQRTRELALLRAIGASRRSGARLGHPRGPGRGRGGIGARRGCGGAAGHRPQGGAGRGRALAARRPRRWSAPPPW